MSVKYSFFIESANISNLFDINMEKVCKIMEKSSIILWYL